MFTENLGKFLLDVSSFITEPTWHLVVFFLIVFTLVVYSVVKGFKL